MTQTRRALTPLLRQIQQRAVRRQLQRLGRTVLHAGGPLFATIAQIAFMRRRFDSALLYRRQDDLHHAKRAGNHTGFTADTFLLIHQDAVVKLADRAIRTTAGARCPFTMVTGYGVTFLLALDNRNTRQKTLRGQYMLLIVMRHDAGNLTSLASDAFMTIA